MTGFLLDTNVLIFSLAAPERIPQPIRVVLEAETVYISAVSYWEILLKSMKGKLEVGDPRVLWDVATQKFAAIPLPLRPEHVAAVFDLPPIHHDPFDRALIAQAVVEGLTLVTSDGAIPQYRSGRFVPLTI